MPKIDSTKTDKQRLLDFVRQHKYLRTSDIIRWGSQHYSNRAERNARELRREGVLVRLTDFEKQMLFNESEEDVYLVKENESWTDGMTRTS